MGLHQRQIALESIKDCDWTGKKILDLGCSHGKLSLEIMELSHATELIGIDTAMDRIALANRMVKEKQLNKMKFAVGSAENLNAIPDNDFDIVFCNMAFQLFEDKQKALNEIYRVLKPGGQAFINFNIEKSPTWMQQEIVYEKLFGDPHKIISKEKTYDAEEFIPMAKRAGFSEVATLIKDNLFYYQSFDQAIDKNDDNFFAKKKGLNPEQNHLLNIELKKLLESTQTAKGIPESWKILFAKLTK